MNTVECMNNTIQYIALQNKFHLGGQSYLFISQFISFNACNGLFQNNELQIINTSE